MPLENINPEQFSQTPAPEPQVQAPVSAPEQSQQPTQPTQSTSSTQSPSTTNSFAAGPIDVRSALTSAGFDASGFQDEQTALQSTINALRQMQQYAPLIQHGQEYMRHREDFDKWRQSQQTTQAPATPPTPSQQQAAASSWNMPKYDQSWDQLTRWDAQLGRYVTIDPVNVSPAVAEARNAYQQSLRTNFDNFMQSPVDTLWGAGLEQKIASIREEIREEFRQELYQREAVQKQTEFLAANERNFYVMNEQGDHLLDPITGQEVLTPKGRVALEAALRARNDYGISNPAQIQEYVQDALAFAEARGLFAAQQPEAAAAPPPSPPQTPAAMGDAKKQNFVQRAVRSNNRNGTQHPADLPETAPLQNPDATLREMNREELRRRGALPQTG